MPRDRKEAAALTIANDVVDQSFDRILVTDRQWPELRFSWWPNGMMDVRMPDLAGGERLPTGNERLVRSGA